MTSKFAHLWLHHRPALILFAAAFCVVFAMGFRLIFVASHWHAPQTPPATPEGWMTPGFVARAWHLPPDDLSALLGAQSSALRGQTLAEIAELQNRPLAPYLAELGAALAIQSHD